MADDEPIQPLSKVVRNRLKSDTVVWQKASDLIPNPKNWRLHPPEQREALDSILRQVGIADVILTCETPEGLQIIDGHLRGDLDPDVKWPCLVLDVDDDDADMIIATHDPIAAMATANTEKLDELLLDLRVDSEATCGKTFVRKAAISNATKRSGRTYIVFRRMTTTR